MYKISFQEVLWGNLYDTYKRKEIPPGVADLVAVRKADEAFIEILNEDQVS